MDKTGIQEGLNNTNIFKNIEATGEIFKQQFKELAEKARKTMDSRINSAKLEAAYALTVPKEQRAKTMTQLREVREELWNKALQQANGDIKKASKIYGELCAFP